MVENTQPYSLAARTSYPSLRHHAERFGILIEAIALRIVWAPDALLRNILEALPVLRKRGSISGRCFVPPKDDIAIGGVIFDQTGFASRLLSSNQCRAGATKRIEHDIAAAAERLFKSGNIPDLTKRHGPLRWLRQAGAILIWAMFPDLTSNDGPPMLKSVSA